MNERQNSTISSLLVESMKTKGLNVEKLSQVTGVSERFITLLVEERLEELPPTPYLHGYVVKIADTLDLDGEEVWERFFKHNETLRSSGRHDRLPENRFVISRLNAKVFVGVGLILIIVAYFVVRSFLAFDVSRELSLVGFEEENITVYESVLKVNGVINPAYRLTINDIRIYPDSIGNFSHTLELREGWNDVDFTVSGFLGKEESVVKSVFYKSSIATSTILNNNAEQ